LSGVLQLGNRDLVSKRTVIGVNSGNNNRVLRTSNVGIGSESHFAVGGHGEIVSRNSGGNSVERACRVSRNAVTNNRIGTPGHSGERVGNGFRRLGGATNSNYLVACNGEANRFALENNGSGRESGESEVLESEGDNGHSLDGTGVDLDGMPPAQVHERLMTRSVSGGQTEVRVNLKNIKF
jgi:hypothetical protein